MATSSPTMESQRIALALSREELYVVMRFLKATYIPGFDLAWLKAAPDGSIPEDVQRALEVATNALIARGYLSLNEAEEAKPMEVTLPSPVIALVGACIFGELSVLLSLYKPEEQGIMYLHKLHQLGVVHTVPLPGVHQFEAVDGEAGILSVIHDVLGLHTQRAADVPKGKGLAIDIQAARDAALAGDMDEARDLLKRSGLPDDTARALGEAMAEATASGAIVIVRRGDDGQFHKATLAVVVSPMTCFALSEEGAQPDFYAVRPISAEALGAWFVQGR
jgi:hypothetical protein